MRKSITRKYIIRKSTRTKRAKNRRMSVGGGDPYKIVNGLVEPSEFEKMTDDEKMEYITSKNGYTIVKYRIAYRKKHPDFLIEYKQQDEVIQTLVEDWVPPPPPPPQSSQPPPQSSYSNSSPETSVEIDEGVVRQPYIPPATEQQKKWATEWIPKRIKIILEKHPELIEEYLYNKKEFQDRVLSFANKTLGGGLRRKKRGSTRTKKYRR